MIPMEKNPKIYQHFTTNQWNITAASMAHLGQKLGWNLRSYPCGQLRHTKLFECHCQPAWAWAYYNSYGMCQFYVIDDF